MQNQQRNGFTLIEILLSVALISFVAGIGVPLFQSFQSRNDFDLSLRSSSEAARRAQILSRGMRENEQWGVYIQNGFATVFKGNTYTLRDDEYDEVYEFSDSVSVSNPVEIIFSKMYGEPNATTSVVFISLATGEEKTFFINEKGTVSY